jgi:protein-tyrosine phosphatase
MRSSALGVPGTFNFRDLGGHRTADGVVRSGVLMRSDALVALGEAGRAALTRLGVRTAIDLRENVERELDPADLAGLGIELHSRPVFDGAIDLETEKGLPELYSEILDVRGERLAGSIGLLSSAGALPAVVFCSAGKDRTGLVCGLVLSAIGVSDEDVAAEYALTGDVLKGRFQRVLEARAKAAGLSEQALAVKLGAPADLMMTVLAGLRARHGGTAAYLRDHGLGAEDLAALRGALVEV